MPPAAAHRRRREAPRHDGVLAEALAHGVDDT
jgi:hypothetical protein